MIERSPDIAGDKLHIGRCRTTQPRTPYCVPQVFAAQLAAAHGDVARAITHSLQKLDHDFITCRSFSEMVSRQAGAALPDNVNVTSYCLDKQFVHTCTATAVDVVVCRFEPPVAQAAA